MTSLLPCAPGSRSISSARCARSCARPSPRSRRTRPGRRMAGAEQPGPGAHRRDRARRVPCRDDGAAPVSRRRSRACWPMRSAADAPAPSMDFDVGSSGTRDPTFEGRTRSRLGTGYGAVTGAKAGVELLGLVGTLLGAAIVGPAVLGIAVVYGGKEVLDERRRRLTDRRQQARSFLGDLIEEIRFQVDGRLAGVIDEMQRQMRSRFGDRIAELQATVAAGLRRSSGPRTRRPPSGPPGHPRWPRSARRSMRSASGCSGWGRDTGLDRPGERRRPLSRARACSIPDDDQAPGPRTVTEDRAGPAGRDPLDRGAGRRLPRARLHHGPLARDRRVPRARAAAARFCSKGRPASARRSSPRSSPRPSAPG